MALMLFLKGRRGYLWESTYCNTEASDRKAAIWLASFSFFRATSVVPCHNPIHYYYYTNKWFNIDDSIIGSYCYSYLCILGQIGLLPTALVFEYSSVFSLRQQQSYYCCPYSDYSYCFRSSWYQSAQQNFHSFVDDAGIWFVCDSRRSRRLVPRWLTVSILE